MNEKVVIGECVPDCRRSWPSPKHPHAVCDERRSFCDERRTPQGRSLYLPSKN
jgi:hypothetical protein